jgi:hypothetical protein
LPQIKQIRNPERAPAGGHRDEHVRLDRIGPARRQRVLPTITIEEEHPIFRPGLADGKEHKLLPTPRMERMRYPNSPVLTVAIGSS